MKIVHVQSVLPKQDVIALKKKSSSETVQYGIIRERGKRLPRFAGKTYLLRCQQHKADGI